ncbi:hypothetical protein [Chlorogloeopsis fritschii]|uniref:hypothetical protein n=1 Tax=Chlorogloeopsis fritschii TaxID=1124 RepID=UPI0023F346F4|nr:hypothetical protein [Chlorogloeopsis fritschii]
MGVLHQLQQPGDKDSKPLFATATRQQITTLVTRFKLVTRTSFCLTEFHGILLKLIIINGVGSDIKLLLVEGVDS